ATAYASQLLFVKGISVRTFPAPQSVERAMHAETISDFDGSTRFLNQISCIRALYFLPEDPLSEEVLIPGFKEAERVECMVGFFSSGALASIAPGLATYISSSGKTFRLIISPLLSKEDLEAIETGLRSKEEIVDHALEAFIFT